MGKPIARAQDQVTAVDQHMVMVPTAGGPVPTMLPHPFAGMLDGALSTSVKSGGMAVATAILYLLTTLSALYPGWMASRLPPAEALRYE